MQLQIDLRKRSWFRPSVAPRVTSAIVGANSGKASHFRLDQNPVEREIAEPGLNNNGGACLACAVHMELVAAQIDQCSYGF